MRRLSVVLCLLFMPLAAAAAPVRLAYVFSDGNTPGTLLAFQSLVREHPELKDKVQLTLLTEFVFDQVDPKALLASDVLVLDTMNEQMLGRFDAKNGTDLVGSIARRGTVLGVGEGLLGDQVYTQKGVIWDPRARAYWTHSGEANQIALMKLALGACSIAGLALTEPRLSLDFGYYYPGDGAGPGVRDLGGVR